MGIILPVTLTAAAAAAIINLWLAIRVGQMRGATKTIHGDDAGGPLTRRMRAQLNFVENTPFVLVLIAAIELHDLVAPHALGQVLVGRADENPLDPGGQARPAGGGGQRVVCLLVHHRPDADADGAK